MFFIYGLSTFSNIAIVLSQHSADRFCDHVTIKIRRSRKKALIRKPI